MLRLLPLVLADPKLTGLTQPDVVAEDSGLGDAVKGTFIKCIGYGMKSEQCLDMMKNYEWYMKQMAGQKQEPENVQAMQTLKEKIEALKDLKDHVQGTGPLQLSDHIEAIGFTRQADQLRAMRKIYDTQVANLGLQKELAPRKVFEAVLTRLNRRCTQVECAATCSGCSFEDDASLATEDKWCQHDAAQKAYYFGRIDSKPGFQVAEVCGTGFQRFWSKLKSWFKKVWKTLNTKFATWVKKYPVLTAALSAVAVFGVGALSMLLLGGVVTAPLVGISAMVGLNVFKNREKLAANKNGDAIKQLLGLTVKPLIGFVNTAAVADADATAPEGRLLIAA